MAVDGAPNPILASVIWLIYMELSHVVDLRRSSLPNLTSNRRPLAPRLRTDACAVRCWRVWGSRIRAAAGVGASSTLARVLASARWRSLHERTTPSLLYIRRKSGS